MFAVYAVTENNTPLFLEDYYSLDGAILSVAAGAWKGTPSDRDLMAKMYYIRKRVGNKEQIDKVIMATGSFIPNPDNVGRPIMVWNTFRGTRQLFQCADDGAVSEVR